MPHDKRKGLSRREREIMDVVYKLGKASAAEIRENMAEPPSYSAVRTLLTILQEKGHVSYFKDGARYIYEAIAPREDVAKRAIENVMETFFSGSLEHLVFTLAGSSDRVDKEEVKRLIKLIEDARGEGR